MRAAEFQEVDTRVRVFDVISGRAWASPRTCSRSWPSTGAAGWIDGGAEGGWVRLTCEGCGAEMARRADED